MGVAGWLHTGQIWLGVAGGTSVLLMQQAEGPFWAHLSPAPASGFAKVKKDAEVVWGATFRGSLPGNAS